MHQQISGNVDGGLSRESRVRRPRSKDPIGVSGNLFSVHGYIPYFTLFQLCQYERLQSKGATVATFYTQKGATVASFYTQKVATLCFGDYVYEARQDNLHPVIVA